MKTFFTIFSYIAGAASIVALGFFIYYQFIFNDIPIIELKAVNIEQLTNLPKVKDLTVEYKYNDSIIKNLWRVKYFVKNSGTKTIIGEGNLKNIIPNNIPLKFKNISKTFSLYTIGNNFPIKIINQKSGQYFLEFKQWKKNEYFEIEGLVETINNKAPEVEIDARDIIEAEVNSSIYELSNESKSKKIIDYLPIGLVNFIKWFIVIVVVIADVAAIFAIRNQLKKGVTDMSISLRIISFILWLITTLIFTAPLMWIF